MIMFKCKMCGGDLDIQEKASVGTCKYCGTKQTLPRIDDDKRANLYERASHFRRQNDFDKAAGIYESILNEDRTDAEAYWSLVLCKYGVEYVEDPATHKRIPTCNRTQYASVLADEDYKQALAHADDSQRSIYEEEAKAIDAIQKGILEISSKEEPFDVFICYKESDDTGRRTPDSVLAQDMYHQLTNEGFKVFFARITLEDKLGSAYEPYIFAALQSSKIMVALGTRPEFFGAVWVKNEWSRFLGMIKGGAKKTLIPAYKDMDPYNLPEEFSHLQAQDMGKLGFMQDLVRGIKKILGHSQPQPAAAHAQAAPVHSGGAQASVQSLMQRAFIELEDGNWDKADGLLEQILNVEPQNARAYVGKLMAEYGIGTEEGLAYSRAPLTESNNYQKAARFADDAYRTTLQGYATSVEEILETQRKQAIYDEAMRAAKELETCSKDSASFAEFAQKCRRVATQFESITGFSDASEWFAEMKGRAERGDQMYAVTRKKERRKKLTKTLIKLVVFFGIIIGISWKPIIVPTYKHILAEKQQKIEAAKAAEEQKKADAAKAEQDKIDAEKAAKEKKLQDAKRAEEKKLAAAARAEAKKQQEAKDKIRAEKYPAAEALVAAGKYEDAMKTFNEIGGYTFGKYDWRILAVDASGKALIITKNIVAQRKFNNKDTLVSWEGSSLRKYLNGDFFNAFAPDERSRIVATKLDNNKYGTVGGRPTTDKVFLLSVDEASKYFADFTKKHPKFKTIEESNQYRLENCDRVAGLEGEPLDWWLRTSPEKPGDFISAYKVSGFWGEIENNGMVDFEIGVRPAMWVKFKK